MVSIPNVDAPYGRLFRRWLPEVASTSAACVTAIMPKGPSGAWAYDRVPPGTLLEGFVVLTGKWVPGTRLSRIQVRLQGREEIAELSADVYDICQTIARDVDVAETPGWQFPFEIRVPEDASPSTYYVTSKPSYTGIFHRLICEVSVVGVPEPLPCTAHPIHVGSLAPLYNEPTQMVLRRSATTMKVSRGAVEANVTAPGYVEAGTKLVVGVGVVNATSVTVKGLSLQVIATLTPNVPWAAICPTIYTVAGTTINEPIQPKGQWSVDAVPLTIPPYALPTLNCLTGMVKYELIFTVHMSAMTSDVTFRKPLRVGVVSGTKIVLAGSDTIPGAWAAWPPVASIAKFCSRGLLGGLQLPRRHTDHPALDAAVEVVPLPPSRRHIWL